MTFVRNGWDVGLGTCDIVVFLFLVLQKKGAHAEYGVDHTYVVCRITNGKIQKRKRKPKRMAGAQLCILYTVSHTQTPNSVLKVLFQIFIYPGSS